MKTRQPLVLLAILIAAFTFVVTSSAPIMAASASKETKTESSSSSTAKKSKAPAGKVNINTADKNALMELTGVGPKTADSIIAYRKANGKFKSADDLLNVKGIGEKTLKKLKPYLKF